MKNRKISVSLYILIPIIFSGISLISALISHNLTLYYRGMGSFTPVYLWITIMVIFTFLCSFITISFLMKPVMKFINKSEKMPIFPSSGKGGSSSQAVKADPAYYAQVFDTITDILDKVQAKELFPRIVGESRVMRDLLSQMIKAAPTDATVLLLGESGTGKELVATSIYEHSLRKEKPFLKLNCVAIPEGLLESELFGHEKGSFTGAVAQKKGKFELADGGTIFLDEIGDMPFATQAKLLRTLQEKEFERVGGNKPIHVDVRFIAATNKDLETLVKQGKFRDDLYFRLNVFPLRIPPLWERREDIPQLCRHFLAGISAAAEISSEALQLCAAYAWPGNVRELQNAIQRAVVLAGEGTIEPWHLPAQVQHDFNGEARISSGAGATLDDRLNNIQKGLIIEALTRSGGVQTKAAQLLGINQRSLWHRIKKLEIDVGSFKKQ
jgi:transcriptional regulator with GAF, ATPase, and Fis domain